MAVEVARPPRLAILHITKGNECWPALYNEAVRQLHKLKATLAGTVSPGESPPSFAFAVSLRAGSTWDNMTTGFPP